MADSFWFAVAPAVMSGAGLSLLVERFLVPPPLPVWRRPAATLAIHLGLWLWLMACLLLVLQRPVFSAALFLAGLLFLILVSNAKYDSLREPFLFQDFEYFRDALRHPRLYLPFLGIGRAVLALLAVAGALGAGLVIEQPLTASLAVRDFLGGSAILALSGLALLWIGRRKAVPVSYEATADLQRLGLMAAMWRYGEDELLAAPVSQPYALLAASPPGAANADHLVVVQSESFFDVRRLFSGVRREVLSEFDALRAGSIAHGQLEVAAWGANTVRTEFAFFSGLSSESLGVHRFNPYRRLARRPMTTLVGFLKSCGYRTVCVHPYHAGFYARDKVFPLLGFDEFIDIRGFAGAARSGPYIGDLAVAEKVCSLLRTAGGQRLFVFVITMENHGPLHLEKVLPGEAERFYTLPPPSGCDDLAVYLRHLCHADRMAGMLRAELENLPGNGSLCWFGDHVPIMPEVYRRVGPPGENTDYFFWQKGRQTDQGIRHDLAVENLGCLLLQEMGLLVAPGEEAQDRAPRRH